MKGRRRRPGRPEEVISERLRNLPQPRGGVLRRARISQLARRARRDPVVAVVLSGGGNLGALQIGMLRALLDTGVRPDLVLGCSVGALNGAALAVDPTPRRVEEMAEHWRTTTSAAVMPAGWVPSALQLIRKGESLHGNAGLRRTVETFIGAARRFDDLRVDFECVATDMSSAAERWFGSGGLVDAVLASAALPAVYPPVTIEGRKYVDGGVVNNVPVSRAFERGAERVYVLHVGLFGSGRAEIRRPVEAALNSYWLARNGRFMRDLEQVPAGVQVIVVPPGERPDLRYDDFTHTDDLIAQGYRAAAEFLERREVLDLPDPAPGFLRRLGFGRPGTVVGAPRPGEAGPPVSGTPGTGEPVSGAPSEGAPATEEREPAGSVGAGGDAGGGAGEDSSGRMGLADNGD